MVVAKKGERRKAVVVLTAPRRFIRGLEWGRYGIDCHGNGTGITIC
jgi:hypothetical protein